MFDLDAAVAAWRARMLAGSAVTESAADEMEDHLRSAVAHLSRTGLTCEEAFLVAAHRLGDPIAIGTEHANVSAPWRRREIRWMLAGVVLASLVPSAAYLVGSTVSLAAIGTGASTIVVRYAGPIVVIVILVVVVLRLARSAARGTGALSRFIDRHSLGAAALALGLLVGVRAATMAVSWCFRYSTDAYLGLSAAGLVSSIVLPFVALAFLAWPRGFAERSAT